MKWKIWKNKEYKTFKVSPGATKTKYFLYCSSYCFSSESKSDSEPTLLSQSESEPKSVKSSLMYLFIILCLSLYLQLSKYVCA